ncbi:undecaprenyl-diphosphatase [Kribbella sp. VKM Ac-2527]|uniref:Undecaprenyl-diphosphatase n=1 Tax=Kribbella caucasensis TaxID=2512215 RepID=A0A4R6KKA2_9ACTN|nr:phosphatase PAP2 family protein [Kribbella sp. VKM Ac-2527]TDO51757.1 undecaprenyl-diphosphatase [Kribbella sp. VKM Ac-2527]
MTTTDQRIRRPAATRYAVPVAGAAVAVMGTLGIIALADSATESDGLAAFDPEFTADAVGSRTAPLTVLARALTFLGDVPVLVVLMLVAAGLVFRATRSWRAPGLLLFAMAGSAALTYGLKALVERHRPGITFVLGPVDTSFAFPSGHTLNSTVFLGMVCSLVWTGLGSRVAKGAAVSAALVLSTGIGLSRVYLGYHWATDVLAGWTVAVTWLAIVVTAAQLTRWLPGAMGRAPEE